MKTENKSCTYNGVLYSHGSVLCQNGKEMVCMEGEWSPTGGDCSSPASKNNVVIDKEQSMLKHVANYSGCFRFAASTEYLKVWLVNTCSSCRTAVILYKNWVNGNVVETTQEFSLQGYSQKLIGSSTFSAEILYDKPC